MCIFRRLWIIVALCAALLGGTGIYLLSPPAQAASNNFGLIFTGASNSAVQNALSKLGISWWYDFSDTGAPPPDGYNKVLLVRTPCPAITGANNPSPARLSRATLTSMASANPGAYWIIGNEPNVPGQDGSCPFDYANEYEYYATNIKTGKSGISPIDPTAKLVAGNVLNWVNTCLNCSGFNTGQFWMEQFFSKYLELYGAAPPVDVWGIHTYLIAWPPPEEVGAPPPQTNLPMVNWQLATQDIAAFRSYLDGNATEAGKPIWVTEFGVIWGYEGIESAPDNQCADGSNCAAPSGQYRQDLISNYLQQMVGWLKANATSKNIQKWFLFTAYGPAEPYATTYTGISAMDGASDTANLSASGQVYRDLVGVVAPTSTPTPSGGGGGGGGGAGGGGAGGGGAGGGTPTATPLPGATPTPVQTPTPTPVPGDTTSTSMGPGGGEVLLSGGSSTDGGVSVIFPQDVFDTSVALDITLTGAPPSGVAPPSGAILLNKTLEVLPQSTVTLRKTAGIRFNLTSSDLGPYSIQDIGGGVVVGDTVEPRPTRIVDASQGILWIDVDHLSKFTLFAITRPGPTLSSPNNGVVLLHLGTTLSWSNPPGTTQYQIQVIPFNNDGPGINLIRNAESSFTVLAPSFGSPDPNYVMLPGMTYTWRVRATTSEKLPADLNEADWSGWALGTFVTTTKLSSSISLISPPDEGTVASTTPTLTWSSTDPETFYYEVQVSKDPSFGPDAFLYWELRHGGATSPPDSYTIPSMYPLERNTRYSWRVRPRIQGDGSPVAWSVAGSFLVAP